MQKTLTILLALAFGTESPYFPAQTIRGAARRIIVVGRIRGAWHVAGHAPPTIRAIRSRSSVNRPCCPKAMRFRSQQVARVASQSQEILSAGRRSSLKPDKKVGVFRMLTLVPRGAEVAQESRQSHAAGTAPARHVRALAGRKRSSTSVATRAWKRCGPSLVAAELRDAAIAQLQVGYGASWPRRLGARANEEDSRYQPHRSNSPSRRMIVRGQLKAFCAR